MLAGATYSYHANHSLNSIRQTRVVKTALFVIWPVLQATSAGLLLLFRKNKSPR